MRSLSNLTSLPGQAMIRGVWITAATVLLLSTYPSSAQVAPRQSSHATAAATYRVAFESTWSASTHPQDFPGNPHFSGLIGATHDAGVSFWEVAGLASAGIESMAETGGKSLLTAEVNTAVLAGRAEFLLSGGGIPVSPGSVLMEFEVSEAFPLVTLVSMLAPSPDWFVGVSGLSLFEDGGWAQRVDVPLVVYDAGTDSGVSYTSANADTDPPEAIMALADVPFDVEQQVGVFVFELLSSVRVEEELPEIVDDINVYPNPSRGSVYVDVTGAADAVQVFDVLGRVLLRTSHAGADGRVKLDLTGYPEGVYVVVVSAGVSTVVRPVVLVR